MLRLFFIFFIFFTYSLNAGDKVEIYASSMTSKDSTVIANDGVTVVYKDYYLSAKKAIYNRKNGDLELFDDIKVTYNNNYRILGNYAKLNIAKKEKMFKPFYMLDAASNVWMSADSGEGKDKIIKISEGIVSGCNQNNPLWKMEFSSSDYNSETKWMNLYNTRLYIYDIPVIYTPYFGYSLDTKRRSGLLMPKVGLSDKEGFYYEQPIYIAEYDSWDLELKPQLRTKRGSGIYSTFRFVDSPISFGELNLGYFKEKDKYFQENDLSNDSHFGFNFLYDNADVINQWLDFDLDGQSGLYIDINKMNDVDYINLSSNDTVNTNTATQVLSRINFFYNTDNNYLATYFKYYEDLTKESNEDTLQKLPTYHYHYYLDSFFKDHLFYDLDAKSTNIERVINKTVLQTDVNIPVTLQTAIFNEFVNVSYRANLYAQHSKFSGEEEVPVSGVEYNDGYLVRNYHTFSASTELTRAFESVTHVISFSSSYTFGGDELRNGFYADHQDTCSDILNQDNPECEFYNIKDVDEVVQLDFSQYLYNLSGKRIFYHRLAQRITYGSDDGRYGELENELDYEIIDGITFYNNTFYNFDESAFSKIFNRISLGGYGITIGLSHLYKDSFVEPTLANSTPRYTSYMTSTARYTYDNHYSYHGRYDYDLESEVTKSAEIGFMYKKRCWDFGIRYVENKRPVLTQSGESSIDDKYLYFSIALKPLMSDGGTSDLAVTLPN